MTFTCVKCSAETSFEVDPEGYDLWKNKGRLIQNAPPPKLTKDQREIMISGLCPKCFKEVCDEGPEPNA